MSTIELVVLVWLLVSLYCLIGVTFRFCVCVTTGEDPVDAIRPRRAMLRDACLWPILAFLVVAIVVAEGVSIGGVAGEFRETARLRNRLRSRQPWEPPDDWRGAA